MCFKDGSCCVWSGLSISFFFSTRAHMGQHIKLCAVDESICADGTWMAQTTAKGLQKGGGRRPTQHTDPRGLSGHAGQFSFSLSPQSGLFKFEQVLTQPCVSFQSEAHDRQQDSFDRMSPLAVAGILTPPKSTEKPAVWRVWGEHGVASLHYCHHSPEMWDLLDQRIQRHTVVVLFGWSIGNQSKAVMCEIEGEPKFGFPKQYLKHSKVPSIEEWIKIYFLKLEVKREWSQSQT